MQLKDVAPSYGVAFVVALSVFFLKYLPMSFWVVLPLQVVIGTIVFFFLCENIKLQEYGEVKRIAIQYMYKVMMRK